MIGTSVIKELNTFLIFLKLRGIVYFNLHMQRCEPQKIYEEMPLLKNLLPEQLRIYSVIKSQFDQGSFISTQL